jgi:hypothetical protein
MRIDGGKLVNGHHCCEGPAGDSRSGPFAVPVNDGEPHPRSFARHCLNRAGWMVPGVLMALIPKCPACLAAYVAGATGLGLSLSAAAYVRALLLILCIASLVYLAVRRLHCVVVERRAHMENTRRRPHLNSEYLSAELRFDLSIKTAGNNSPSIGFFSRR